jgi:choline dehydrogenase-like flavoprotein
MIGRNGELALEGARKLGWHAAPLDHNAVDCGGCCQSAIGCPRNAKNGVWLNALPEACTAGARIVSDATVERVLHERGRATGVEARRPDGSTIRIDAARIVIAAGAPETPLLLRRSGLGRHPAVGTNLSIHPALALLARFDEPVTAWSGVLQSVGVEAPDTEGVLMEATSAPFGMGWTTFPGHGRRLLAELDRAEHYGSLGALIADRSSGRVSGKRRAIIRYDLHRDDQAKLRKAILRIGQVLLAAGAREVVTGLQGAEVVHSNDGLLEALTSSFEPKRLHLAGFHPVGTVAAGGDEQRHPVAADGHLRGVDGVWIADASILPSCPEVNPQVTIMALALAVAEGIVEGV